jgi:hypothetical protein
MGVGGYGQASIGLPTGKDSRYPLYRRLNGAQGRCGQVRKISLLQTFDSRTVRPIAICYTNYAISAHTILICFRSVILYFSFSFFLDSHSLQQ